MYFGWYVVAAAAAVYMILIGTTFNAFGFFVLPVSTELGLSRASMNTGIILLNFGNALLAPVVGRLLDRYPVKRIMLICALIFGASLATLAISRSIWLSAFVLAVPLAFGFQGAGNLTVALLVPRWFTAQRGRAMSLAALGMSFAVIFVAPAIGMLIEWLGWRTTLLVEAAVVTTLLSIIALSMRDRPGPNDIEPGMAARGPNDAARPTAGPPPTPAKMSEILAMPQFWVLSVSGSLAMATGQALIISLVPLALDEGLSVVQATSLLSIMGVAAIATKLLLAVIADKIDRIVLLTSVFALTALVDVVLLLNQSYTVLLGCSAMLGVITGTTVPIYNALLADRFGMTSFGTVRGLTIPVIAVFGAAAVRLAGEIFDRTGNYDLMFAIFIGVQVVAATLMLTTRMTRPVTSTPAPAAA